VLFQSEQLIANTLGSGVDSGSIGGEAGSQCSASDWTLFVLRTRASLYAPPDSPSGHRALERFWAAADFMLLASLLEQKRREEAALASMPSHSTLSLTASASSSSSSPSSSHTLHTPRPVPVRSSSGSVRFGPAQSLSERATEAWLCAAKQLEQCADVVQTLECLERAQKLLLPASARNDQKQSAASASPKLRPTSAATSAAVPAAAPILIHRHPTSHPLGLLFFNAVLAPHGLEACARLLFCFVFVVFACSSETSVRLSCRCLWVPAVGLCVRFGRAKPVLCCSKKSPLFRGPERRAAVITAAGCCRPIRCRV
jgi:hypothetical protein